MRNFLFAVVFLLGGIFIFFRFAEVQQVAITLKGGDWRYIGIAFLFEFLWLLCISASYKVIYHAMGVEEKFDRLILISSASNFVNVVAPSAGMGGMAVLISESKRKGNSSGRVTAAGVLFVLFDYLGFLFVLTAGLFVLYRRNNLSPVEISASVILLAVAAFLAILVVIGLRSGDDLARVLVGLAGRVNRILSNFSRRQYLSEQRARNFALEASVALNELKKKPLYLSLAIILGFTSKLILLFILLFCFLAFDVPFSPGTIIAGFSIGYLFFIVSPTPAGIGFVEGGLALALTTMGVPLGTAAVITLAYRGITFWLPLIFGMIAFRLLPHTGGIRSAA
ncbi:MAG: lysylphosphatidylglycerol synthase transmembrane domain-containing protein [Anaerolineales bacterium]